MSLPSFVDMDTLDNMVDVTLGLAKIKQAIKMMKSAEIEKLNAIDDVQNASAEKKIGVYLGIIEKESALAAKKLKTMKTMVKGYERRLINAVN